MQATALKFTGLIVTGLLAGVFIYALINVVPAFYEVPISVHIIFRTQLMNHNGIVMPILMGLGMITPLWYALLTRHYPAVRDFAILSACLALITFLITRFGNVPINQMIRTWSPTEPPADWKSILSAWNTFHLIRTLTALACFVTSIISTHFFSIKEV